MSRKEFIRNHYEPRLEKYDENSSVLDWENRDAQYKRFSAMTDNVDIEGKSLLDIGCGCGDLYLYLKELQIGVDYTGVDILEKMIDRAKECCPQAVFRCADIFSGSFSAGAVFGRDSFNITYASGIFNLNDGGNEEFLKTAVPVMAELADWAFVFNMLNPASPDPDPDYFYYPPEEATALASEWASEIRIIDDYLANDYTLICFK